jgi:SAM-dependent methyltransferase
MSQEIDLDADRYGDVTATYYDAAYAALLGPAPDIAFYRELARSAGGPVLELGCGTGRVLLEIAKQGIPCAGLDLSPRMLDKLREKSAATGIELLRAPMQRFALDGKRFRLIYSAFRAFQHMYTVEDQLACLACVRRHLLPGGSFAFDVFNPRPARTAIADEPESVAVRFELGGDEVVRHDRVQRDTGAQLLRVHMRYERKRPDGAVRNDEVEFQMRWFYRFEIEHLLARAGFREIAIYGDFEKAPFVADSPSIVAIAREP